MPTATFHFGSNNEHEARVVCGYLGAERYFVDGKLAHEHWSLKPKVVRQFEVHGHTIRIDFSANLNEIKAKAFVDGELIAADLFAAWNQWFKPQRRALALFITFSFAFAGATEVLIFLKSVGAI
ncbi:MAG: hypothetical protein V4858_01300 [Pseudomonadota bacterium]